MKLRERFNEGVMTMKIKQLLIVFILSGFLFLLDASNGFIGDIAINKGSSEQLFKKISGTGYNVFGGKESENNQGGIKNLLSDDPIIVGLDDTIDDWRTLLMNFKSWVVSSNFNKKKREKYEATVNELSTISNELAIYSEIMNNQLAEKKILPELLSSNLDALSDHYFEYYARLLPLVKNFPHRTAVGSMAAYEKLIKNVDFSIFKLFTYYRSTFKLNPDVSKEKNILIALTRSHILDGDESYEEQQEKVTPLINLLEELLYQSKGLFAKTPFTKEQIKDIQTIIHDLYFVYPASQTYTNHNIIKLAKSQDSRPDFLLWSFTQILLITARAYLRKAELLHRQKV